MMKGHRKQIGCSYVECGNNKVQLMPSLHIHWPYSPVYTQLHGLHMAQNIYSPSGCRLFREANWVMGPVMHISPLCPRFQSPSTLSPADRPHPPLGRRTILAPLHAEVEQWHCCRGSMWSALQLCRTQYSIHELRVGAAEILFNLYNEKYIAF